MDAIAFSLELFPRLRLHPNSGEKPNRILFGFQNANNVYEEPLLLSGLQEREIVSHTWRVNQPHGEPLYITDDISEGKDFSSGKFLIIVWDVAPFRLAYHFVTRLSNHPRNSLETITPVTYRGFKDAHPNKKPRRSGAAFHFGSGTAKWPASRTCRLQSPRRGSHRGNS